MRRFWAFWWNPVMAFLLLCAAFAGLAALLLATQVDDSPSKPDQLSVVLEDGRSVDCLVFSYGVSCDWAGAR